MRNGTDGDRRAESGMMRAGCSRSSAAQLMCDNSHMTARSGQHEGEPGWFTSPQQVNQRRYEALRAYFVGGLSYAQAGARFGYTRWAMINLVREHRAGNLELFAPPRRPGPAPGTAPARDRVRGRVIALRRLGLSSYEISARLSAEGTPLNRTSVAEILTEEGFGRLLRGPAPEASISPATPGRDTNLPAATVIDFGTWPEQLDTTRAGLLLAIPDLVSLDLPALAAAEEAVFDLDFHAIMHWGRDPVLEKHYVPTRSQRARSVLTFFAQDTGT